MSYFKINGNDYSTYVNALNIKSNVVFRAQTNVMGDTVVDNAKTKRVIEVGIIPLNEVAMKTLMEDVEKFEVTLSFRNPNTNALEENVLCIIPSTGVEYYTIRADKVLYKAFTLSFTEL